MRLAIILAAVLSPSVAFLGGMPAVRRQPSAASAVSATADAGTAPTAAEALLDAVRGLDRGMAASAADRKRVNALIDDCAAVNPTLGRGADAVAELGTSTWSLLYTDAPDILGIRGGPLARVDRIGQEITPSENRIANVIEYCPSEAALRLGGALVRGDRVTQRVLLGYETSGGDLVDLKLQGISLTPNMFLGQSVSPSRKLAGGFGGQIPAPTFGAFDYVYFDGIVRIVKTKQGWVSINVLDPLVALP